MKKSTLRRMGLWLLILSLTLTLLPFQALAEEENPQEAAAETAVEPETPAETPETPAEEPEAPTETPETPAEEPETPTETPETPAEEPETPEEKPALPEEEIPSEEETEEARDPAELLENGGSALLDNVAVTTVDAFNVEAFSADLPVQANNIDTTQMSIYEILKQGGEVGVEYRPASETRINRRSAGISEIEAAGGFINNDQIVVYTFSIECAPGTTYEFRAFVQEGWDSSEENIKYGEWKEFTTPGISDPTELTPGTPLDFTLVGDEIEYSLGYTVKESGLYTLAAEGIEGNLSVWDAQNSYWNYPDAATPVYMEANAVQYLRFYASGSEDSSRTGKITLSRFNPPTAEAGEALTLSGNGYRHYFQFTPQEAGRYKISVEAAAGNESSGLCTLYRWDSARLDFSNVGYFSGGGACTLTLETGTQYFQLEFSGETGYTVTVSKFEATVFDYSLEPGSVRSNDGFTAWFSATVEAPLDSYYLLGVEYKLGPGMGQTGRQYRENSSEVRTVEVNLDTLPNSLYRYRLFLTPTDGERNPIQKTVYGEWETFLSGEGEITPLRLNTETALTSYTENCLSFTPEASGYYRFSASEGCYISLWDDATASWMEDEYYSRSNTKVAFMEAGTTRYVKTDHVSSDNSTITVSRMTPTVKTFTVNTGAAENIADFSAQIPVTATVPLGSSFHIEIEYNYTASFGSGTGTAYARNQTNFSDETCKVTANMDVLPKTEYKYRAVLYENGEDGIDWENPTCTSGWKTFTTGPFDTTDLTLNTPESIKVSDLRQPYLSFTPSADRFYQVKLEGTGSGALYLWNAAESGWDYSGTSDFSGSAAWSFSGKQGVPVYMRLYLYELSDYQATVTEFDPPETNVTMEAGEIQTVTPGFLAKIPVEVKAAPGTLFSLRTEVKTGGSFRANYNRSYTSTSIEKTAYTVNLDTIPNTNCTWRVRLDVLDANYEPVGTPIYSAEKTFQSGGSIATELKPGQRISGGAEYVDNYFSFTPETTGTYLLSTVNVEQMRTADSGTGEWDYRYVSGKVQEMQMQAGVTRYFTTSNYRSGSYTLEIVPQSSASAVAISASKPPAETANPFSANLTLTCRAPLESWFEVGFEYKLAQPQTLATALAEETAKLSAGRYYSRTSEEITVSRPLALVPGTAYEYRAYLNQLDGSGKVVKTHTSQEWQTVQASESEIRELAIGTPVTSVTADRCLRFTPAETGVYQITGGGALLAMFPGSGQWTPLPLREDFELEAGTALYLRTSGATAYNLTLTQTLRSARQSGNTVSVNLASSLPAGQYFLAAYDANGKLLAAAVRSKSGGAPVNASLQAGSTADHVKVFRTNNTYQPQEEAAALTIQH